MMTSKISDRPWSDWAKRIVIEVPHYLNYRGDETSGGRQRKVRDLARLASESGMPALVVQKSLKPFEKEDRFGVHVVGVTAPLGAVGGPIYALKTRRILRVGDAFLTVAQEDGWPFFVKNAKAFHTGVWWDGPFSAPKLWLNRRRTLGLVSTSRSVISVDTNFINWIRCQGSKGLQLASKCEYLPNYADLGQLPTPIERDRPGSPLRILFARRYERKRGGELFLDALSNLQERGLKFEAILSLTIGGADERQAQTDLASRHLQNNVRIVSCDMDTVYDMYKHADVSVVPTIWSEGTSYSCVEAICAGVPVVVTPVGGLGNLVIPGFNGLIVSPVSNQLADAIAHLADPTAWGRMHRGALQLREALGKDRWKARVRDWLLS